MSCTRNEIKRESRTSKSAKEHACGIFYGNGLSRRGKLFVGHMILVFAVFLLIDGCARRGQVAGRGETVVIHKVQEGETLETIAEDYYGDPSRSEELMKANDLGTDRPEPGTVVRLVLSRKDIDKLKMRKAARIPYNQGLELASKGTYLEAIGKFQDALLVDPGFTDARYNLGVTYQKMKAYKKAEKYLEEAVHSRPENPSYLFALGNCYFHLEEYKKAAEAFSGVIQLEPGHLQARYSLAAAYEKMGEKEKACDAWRDYLRLDGTSEWAREARKRLEKLKK